MRRVVSRLVIACGLLMCPSVTSAALIGDFQQISPNAVTYVLGVDFQPFTNSALGDVTASLYLVDYQPPVLPGVQGTSGCEAADFAGFAAGGIALLQRGTCTFDIKVQNAAAAGASAVIIFNDGVTGLSTDRTGLLQGTLTGGVSIPVIGVPYLLGTTFALNAPAEVVRIEVTDSTAVAPEPATLLLLGLGLGMAALRRRL